MEWTQLIGDIIHHAVIAFIALGLMYMAVEALS